MTPEDLIWVKLNHPDLVWDKQRKRLYGELAFRMYYSPNEPDQYYINPKVVPDDPEGELIEDVYEVDICWEKDPVPIVREVGGRISATAEKWGIEDLVDLHTYLNGTSCLYPKPEERHILQSNFSLQDFFYKALIPYFYYQSYFERHGKEPWPGYAHGWLGILESYYNISERYGFSETTIQEYLKALQLNDLSKFLKAKEIKGHNPCFCKSGKVVRKCHKHAAWGFNNLLRDAKLLKTDSI